MSENLMAVKSILKEYRGNLCAMTGPSNATNRQRIMELLTGTKQTKSQCGINALENMVFATLNVDTSQCLAHARHAVIDWAMS